MTPASFEAVVMAAGEGRRLRPITERYAKAVLPIDGRPVIATLLRELGRGGVGRVTVVTGHLAEQVEGLVGDGAAVLRAALAPPYLVLAADTIFRAGDVEWFADAFAASGATGAIAIRKHPGKDPIRVERGRVTRIPDNGGPGPWSGAPLWALGDEIARHLGTDERPYELTSACQRAIDAGAYVAAIEIGPTRDLTDPLDLVRENFPYLAGT